MQANRDVLLFIGIFLGIFLIWVATGGPQRAQESDGSTTGGSQLFGSGITIGPGGVPAGGNTSRETPRTTNGDTTEEYAEPNEIARELRRARSTLDDVARDVKELERFGVASRFADYVRLERAQADEASAEEEYVVISVSDDAPTAIPITGWQIVSKITGTRVTIGAGTALPRHGSVNREQPITLKSGHRALISSGPSPIGTSFRENRCTGYFEQFQAFTPDLPTQCPRPIDTFETHAPAAVYTEANDTNNDGESNCRAFINRLDRCTVPTVDLDRVTPPLSRTCQRFIEQTFTYSQCVTRTQEEPDFTGTTWRIYLNSTGELWQNEREVLRLVDDTGRTVDVATY
jgi:hypothetical protein